MGMHKSMCTGGAASCDLDKMVKTSDVTLGDYIKRKQDAAGMKKKLTFEDWFVDRFSNPDDFCYDWCKEAWKAAQENM